jgi:nucleotide-binding universal stress UspA family protein
VEDLLLGGVTQHVLAQARCDVLIAGETGTR